ncbi:hypothetical protein B0H16DRAFT_1822615 [Mycena metata]|uniref:Uncharacterized protein n=1 Tax=Mycena metata TaxID=1033252 RepID=A0AAD7J6C2_9AGAR|nr:hypothetical protein B0H16DRAFT_1822615 [Mycena metata]
MHSLLSSTSLRFSGVYLVEWEFPPPKASINQTAQMPQIWAEYMSADTDDVLARRIPAIRTSIADKKAQAAEARKKKAAAAAAAKEAEGERFRAGRPARDRRQTERAKAMAMDVDLDPDAPPDAGAALDASDAAYDDSAASGQKRQRQGDGDEDSDEEEEREARSPPNLHPDDMPNFCKLASAVKLLLARPITDAQIDEADALLRSYLPELMTLYGKDVIKPNHHYATHTAENVRDYGPLQEFWTFLFERINKVLKSYNSSNHSGGELETSFFREFHRTIQTSRILAQAASFPPDSPLAKSVETMYKATNDDRGTVQALARQLDKAQEDGGIDFQLSPKFSIGPVDSDIFHLTLRTLQIQLPLLNIRSWLAVPPPSAVPSLPLFNQMKRFPYAIIGNRRYSASLHAKTAFDSYVLVRTHALPEAPVWAGELREIFVVDEPKIGVHHYGFVEWFVPENPALAKETVWANFGRVRGPTASSSWTTFYVI